MATLARIQIIPRYVSDLRTKTGYYLGYVPTEYADQPEQDGFYPTLRRDPEIFRCLHLLSLMTAGESVCVECDDPACAEACRFALSGVHDFVHARKSLVEKAVLFGLGIQRKYYERADFRGVPLVRVHHLAEVDRRRMRLERDEDERDRLRWSIWHPKADQYVLIEDRSENPDAQMGCAVQDYWWHWHMTEESYPYHEGLGETLYPLAYIKAKAMQYWGDLAESWSKPFLAVTIDTMKAAISANLGSGFPTAAERIENILSTFEKTRARHMAVLDSADKLDFHEHGSSGSNIIGDLVAYCDRKIQLMVLGAELTTTTAGVGSYALGAVHKVQTDTVVQYSRLRLAETIREDLLLDFFYRNFRGLKRLGIRTPEHGEIRVSIRVETPQPQGGAEPDGRPKPPSRQQEPQEGQPDEA